MDGGGEAEYTRDGTFFSTFFEDFSPHFSRLKTLLEGGVGMDGGGEAEYTRDPALLSPNDPHQSTSTVQQTATVSKNRGV